jgi:hypothetical protein
MAWLARGAVVVCALVVAACGAKTPLEPAVDAGVLDARQPEAEQCNGRDDDLDGDVDEPFRDDDGRYVHPDHCGGCGRPCRPTGEQELAVQCTLLDDNPVCAATQCAEGYVPSTTGRCVDAFERLCLPCLEDGECGDFEAATCAHVGGEQRCTVGCELGCPEGYTCSSEQGVCVPEGGSCSCDPGEQFTLACALEDPEGNRCVGQAVCEDGSLSECAEPQEVCDEVDNDCDGMVDEPFRDERGAYIEDIHNCGECGVDCTESEVPEGDLKCGGDPFAPSCVLACPDAEDGIDPGDRIDADREIATGCECTVGSLDDQPGPVGASGQALDVNCDGADGIVVDSIYVATDGDDDGPGSPTRPMETVSAAVERAAESLDSDDPRPHVFVASGNYTETVELQNGVKIHGGYRRDFLALDPSGFRVELRAPSDTDAPGGAALVADGVGSSPTLVEWVTVQGSDATAPSAPAFGASLVNPGAQLQLRSMQVRSGDGGSGMPGADGDPGAQSATPAEQGAPPRAAIEDASHQCIEGEDNRVAGGEGGSNSCGGVDVSGGEGGSPGCPEFAQEQPPGQRGDNARGLTGGEGGTGGQDSEGPIEGRSCSQDVCCGLADFTVPSRFQGPEPGEPGQDGSPGEPGRACTDALGQFEEGEWVAGAASAGTAGNPGSGGGGGGAGGGAEIEWHDGDCEFRDGLGGGGGGGGAGGCGGRGGQPGTSGGPSVALLIRYTRNDGRRPSIEDVRIAPGNGGRGGDGGAGGEGGRGGGGALGGELPREEQSTPTLAGPFPGARGGPGGAGGAGGGGGGGCGGGSVGIWVTGAEVDTGPWQSENEFDLGRAGRAGRGGGGGAPAEDGATAGAMNVVVQ